MDATVSAILHELNSDLKPLHNLNNPFYTDPNFLGAIVASVVALFIAVFSDTLRKVFLNGNLYVDKVLDHKQGNGDLILYRLLITNKGNYPAKDVEVYVDNVIGKNNFLPVPLIWTHARAYMTPGVYRNIHPNQSVMLDLCEFTKSRKLLKFRLAAGDEVEDFCILDGNNKEITLKIYQEDGKTISVKLKLTWASEELPQISII